MDKRKKLATAAVAALAIGGAGAGIAIAGSTGGDDAEGPITGSALDQASAAALDATGGGQVTETETGDEESYYEVGVTLPDGSQTDVQVNRDFDVVGSETDGADEDEGAADDD